MRLSERIKELRKQKRWTQRELADHAQVTLGYIRRLEQERGGEDAQKLYKTLECLDVFSCKMEAIDSSTVEGLVLKLKMGMEEKVKFWQRMLLSWVMSGLDIQRPARWGRIFNWYRLPYCPTFDYVMGRIRWGEDEFSVSLNGKTSGFKMADFEEAMRRTGIDERQKERIRHYIVSNEQRWYKVIEQLAKEDSSSQFRLSARIRIIELKQIV